MELLRRENAGLQQRIEQQDVELADMVVQCNTAVENGNYFNGIGDAATA